MRNLSIKKKSILLGVVPLLVVTVIITGADIWRISQQRAAEKERYRNEQMEIKRDQLKQFIQIATSSISDLYEENTEKSKQEALTALNKMRYGEKGYFSVFSVNGVALANAGFPQFVGKQTRNNKDSKGTYTSRGIIQSAISGDGYHRYFVPIKNNSFEKLTYSIHLPDWDWVIAAGFLIHDVDESVSKMEQRFNAEMVSYTISSAVISFVCLMIALLIARTVANSLIQPLNKVVEAMNDIGAGGGDLTRRLDTTGGEEVSALAHGFKCLRGKSTDFHQ